MKNLTYGIDHPVIAGRDFARLRAQFERLGFAPSPVGQHPWGTSMSLLMFADNFVELIAVTDPSRFGTNSVGGFCYGRNVGRFTDRAEGLALLALHSRDADRDHAAWVKRGLGSQGRIDFRRQMTKPDGAPDTAVVSLGLFLNDADPDFSHFICHQHRPELIWVPEWQNHPNGASGVARVSYLAQFPERLAARLSAMYGEERMRFSPGRIEADTGCGSIEVLSPEAAAQLFGGVALPEWGDAGAHGIGLGVRSRLGADALLRLWRNAGIYAQWSHRGTLVVEPRHCGNVMMEFEPSA